MAVVESPSSAHDVRLLDHPIWNALTTEHSALALGDGLARRYPAEIGPLSALAEQSAEAYESLRALTGRRVVFRRSFSRSLRWIDPGGR